MRTPLLITLGIASYLFFLVLNLPAQHVIGWVLSDSSGSPVRLMGTSGTIWSGEAETVVYQKHPLGKVKWSFKPSNLLLGRLSYQFELTDVGQKLTGVALRSVTGNYRLQQVEGLLLANRIPQLMGQRQVDLNGKLDLSDLSLDYSDGRLSSSEGRIRWLDAAVTSPLNLQVGDLQADLSTDDNGAIIAKIKDIKGPTGVNAEVSLKDDGNFQLDGSVKPSGNTDPGLSSALRAISKAKPDGSFQLKYSGKI
jgi:general secretion pathway protein N